MPPRAELLRDEVVFSAYLRETEAPHSIEAEQSVLGGILIDNAAWPRVGSLIKPSDFFRAEHRDIFGAIAALIDDGRPADVITVFEQLQRTGNAKACGGLTYLNDLAQSVPSAANVRRYAELVAEKAGLRRLQAAGDSIRTIARNAPDVQQALADARQVLGAIKTAEPPARFRLMSAADLHGLPRLTWVIHSVLPSAGTAAVFGPSTSGKSFLALDMTAAGGEGGHWFGHKVTAGRWVYVALEGQSGFRRRVEAWEANSGRAFPDAVRFMFEPFKLTDRDNVLAFAASIDAAGGADVIVIDTLNRAAPEADENSSQDMGAILEGVKELQATTGGLVVLVHHSGKDAAKGMRGHSSLFAALDAAIEVTRSDERREWKVAKSKDGEDGEAHPFRLRVVDLGEDDDGEPITSCVVAQADEDEDGPPARRLPKGGNQRIVYDALGPLFRASTHFGRAGAPPQRPCLTLDEAIDGTRERLAVEPKRRNERARQAITGLIAMGVLGSNEGWLWLK